MKPAPPGLLGRLARALLGRRVADAPPESSALVRDRFRVAGDDLLREYTREEVEAHECAVDPLGGVAPVPFGHLNPVWQRFVAALEPGDRIWRFNAQRVAANGDAVIRSGYVAVRAGVPQRPLVATLRTVGADAPLARLAASTDPVTADLVGPARPCVGSAATPSEPESNSTNGTGNETDGSASTANPRYREPATVE